MIKYLNNVNLFGDSKNCCTFAQIINHNNKLIYETENRIT